jgi:hypothetical protein
MRKTATVWASRIACCLRLLAGGGGLFDERRVLLRHPVELRHAVFTWPMPELCSCVAEAICR